MTPTVVRRRLLLSLLFAILPTPLAAAVAPRRSLATVLLPHIEAARLIGQRYLATAPQERSAAFLTRMLFGETPPGGQGLASRAWLVQAIETGRLRDFANGETVILDGWLLARTEARLCALAALA